MNPYDDEALSYTPEEPDFLADEMYPEGSSFFPVEEPQPIPPVSVDELPKPVHAVSVNISELIERVDEQGEVLGKHSEDITWLLEQFKPGNKNKPVDWSWHHITGVRRRELWEDLVDFVAWINNRYFIHHRGNQIVPCWYRHPVVVEELTGLWASWWDATHNAKKPNAKLVEFHRRYFWPTMEQIWKELKSCDGPKGHMVYGGVVRDDDPGMMDFIGQEVEEYAGPLVES